MKHELVCYSCSQCYYKATTNGSLKKHVEPINESSTPVMDVILKEQQRVFLINMYKQFMKEFVIHAVNEIIKQQQLPT